VQRPYRWFPRGRDRPAAAINWANWGPDACSGTRVPIRISVVSGPRLTPPRSPSCRSHVVFTADTFRGGKRTGAGLPDGQRAGHGLAHELPMSCHQDPAEQRLATGAGSITIRAKRGASPAGTDACRNHRRSRTDHATCVGVFAKRSWPISGLGATVKKRRTGREQRQTSSGRPLCAGAMG
jgi:hypothetical protein